MIHDGGKVDTISGGLGELRSRLEQSFFAYSSILLVFILLHAVICKVSASVPDQLVNQDCHNHGMTLAGTWSTLLQLEGTRDLGREAENAP